MGRGDVSEPLASRKVVKRELRTEGSETAKVGTNEQEPDKRLYKSDKVAHHTDVQTSNRSIYAVDPVGIDRKRMLLPGEVSISTCARMEKSAEVIVPDGKRAGNAKPIFQRSHKRGRTERHPFQIRYGALQTLRVDSQFVCSHILRGTSKLGEKSRL